MKTLRISLLLIIVLLVGAALGYQAGQTVPAAEKEKTKISPVTAPVLPKDRAPATDGFLREEQNGEIVELRSHYPGGHFQYMFVDHRNGAWTMWLSSGLFAGSQRDSRTQRFISEDGLTWHDRTDTNLIREDIPYYFVAGPRQVLYDGERYEAWEEFYPTNTFGWGRGIRYETSQDGLDWTIENEPALIGARFASVCKTGGLYHMWAIPDGDNNPNYQGGYQGIEAVRHRVSELGGSDWGDWEKGGEWLTVDGEQIKTLNRVNCLPDGRYEIFYVDGSYHIHRAVSKNGTIFETVQKSLVQLTDIPGFTKTLQDFAVVNVDGKYRFYITFRDDQKLGRIAVLEANQR